MAFADNEQHAEIIIVRRGGNEDEEGHHGGVWKIAFADFMTAMMCFFLVMWLINAANEETRVSVASYFNPVKLVDKNSAKRGLDSLGEGPMSADSDTETSEKETKEPADQGPNSSGPAEAPKASDSTDTQKFSDQHLFKDPYAVLAEIAGETGTQQNISAKGEGGAADAGPATGASGGEAYRDPFAPDFWSEEAENLPPPASVETLSDEAAADDIQPGGKPTEPATATAEAALAPDDDLLAAFPAAPQSAATGAGDKASADVATPSAMAMTEKSVPVAETKGEKSEAAKSADAGPSAETVASRVGAELRKAFGADDRMFGGISVVPTDKGVTISVTDQLNVGMFEIGSAVPKRDLVLAMEKISRVLMAEKGFITINGHTDGRPFAGKDYDNWRLSTARAQSAFYMLARAGLDQKRIVEIAGFADRKLKVKDDPYADANRRIEILLETGN
jgi:chemotaxis protein MotB